MIEKKQVINIERYKALRSKAVTVSEACLASNIVNRHENALISTSICTEKIYRTRISQWRYLIHTCFAKRQLDLETFDTVEL